MLGAGVLVAWGAANVLHAGGPAGRVRARLLLLAAVTALPSVGLLGVVGAHGAWTDFWMSYVVGNSGYVGAGARAWALPGRLVRLFVPPPSGLPLTFWRELAGGYWSEAVGASLSHYIMGLTIGTALGVALGVATALSHRLEALSRRHNGGGVRGRGLLQAIDLARDIAPAVAAKAFQRGLLINAPRPDSLRFMPALTVSHAEIDQMIDILDETLAQMADTRPQ